MHKDYGMIVCEEMIEEISPGLALGIGAGVAAAGGVASSHFATEKNKKNLAKLQKAKAACGNDEACSDRYDELITKYKAKTANSTGSKIKRGVGGAATGMIGVGAYHAADSLMKGRKMKQIIKKLKFKLSSCNDDQCRNKIRVQIDAMNDKFAHIK